MSWLSPVIASAAKQSIAAAERKRGLLRRFAPRNDDRMTNEINPQALRAPLYLFERDEALPLIGAG
jgi:hypothetical protein